MQLRQLEYFCTAAKYEHFTRAAKALCISQPSLSNTLKALEDELGVTLFETNGRGICLTPSGKYFYRAVSIILRELEAAVSQIQSQEMQLHSGITTTNRNLQCAPGVSADTPGNNTLVGR